MSGSDKQKMVGWYDPGQLLQTAGQVVVSTIFGKNSDQRMIEALFADVDPVSLPDPSDPGSSRMVSKTTRTCPNCGSTMSPTWGMAGIPPTQWPTT